MGQADVMSGYQESIEEDMNKEKKSKNNFDSELELDSLELPQIEEPMSPMSCADPI